MHSADAERLEWLEMWVKNSDEELEKAVELADRANIQLANWRTIHQRRVQARDEFRAAMEGMGCKL